MNISFFQKIKSSFIIAFFVFSFMISISSCYAQLYVSNNSYLFNKGALVFAQGNVELNGSNSFFYNRNEGQLLQGSLGSSSNIGAGKLSIFQEGTVNNYAYNYWCSPVGNASAAVGNEDFGITMLNLPITSTMSNPATIISDYNGESNTGTLSISSYWIWKFLTSTSYSQWIHTEALTNISAGQGFTMKGTEGIDTTNPGEFVANNIGSSQRYDFRGKPNDGVININVVNGSATLTGNPYPSAIDLNMFLTDPSNYEIDGTALFWEQDKTVNSHNIAEYRGGYGTYNGTTSIYTPATFYSYDIAGNQGTVFSNPNNVYQRRFSPIGQGFMVRGIANGVVQMKNSYRVFVKEGITNYSQFEKITSFKRTLDDEYFDDIPNVAGIDYTEISKAPTPHFIINTSLNNQAVRQIAIGFMSNSIDGVDKADSKFPVEYDDITSDAYLLLNNLPYVHSITNFDINKRFQIGFKNSGTSSIIFTLKVNNFINFDTTNVFLFDALTGIYHDIKNSHYELSLLPGTYNNRFEITFTNQALHIDENLVDSLSIVQNNNEELLIISNPNNLQIESLILFDLTGKEIINKYDFSEKSFYEFSTDSFCDGVYIVKIKLKNGYVKTQKIIII